MSGPYLAKIDWQADGKPDYLFGTGATRQERGLVLVGALLTGTLVVYLALTGHLGWNWWQFGLALMIALDTGGGVIANSLSSCKRTYHAPLSSSAGWQERLLKNHFAFSLMHIYTLVVALLFPGGDWLSGLAWYLGLLASSALILRLPLYLKRPAAIGLCFAAAAAALYLPGPAPGFAWLGPALFLKIIYGHLVPEEPYRP